MWVSLSYSYEENVQLFVRVFVGKKTENRKGGMKSKEQGGKWYGKRNKLGETEDQNGIKIGRCGKMSFKTQRKV